MQIRKNIESVFSSSQEKQHYYAYHYHRITRPILPRSHKYLYLLLKVSKTINQSSINHGQQCTESHGIVIFCARKIDEILFLFGSHLVNLPFWQHTRIFLPAIKFLFAKSTAFGRFLINEKRSSFEPYQHYQHDVMQETLNKVKTHKVTERCAYHNR